MSGRWLVRIALVAVVGSAPLVPAGAQMAEREVMKTVTNLFDAMRAKDLDLLASVFDSTARLVRLSQQTGQLSTTPIRDFIGGIGRLEAHVDERIWDSVVQIDGPLAQVWTKYDVLVDGEFSHCGVDAFDLMLIGGAWKIVHVADTQRREGCWRYPGS